MEDQKDVALEEEATAATEPEEDQEPEQSDATENTEEKGQDSEDPPAEPESEEEKGEEEVSKSKARRERRKAEMARLREEAEEAKRKSEEREKRLAEAKQAATGSTPPKESDFGSYDEYLIALGQYTANQTWDRKHVDDEERETEQERKRAEELERESEALLRQEWQEQVDDARTRYQDFDAVAFSAPIDDDTAKIVSQMEQGADVAYYLGTHREQARKLARMTPIERAITLGRIEAHVSLPKPKTMPSAPDPVQPVKPRSSGMKRPDAMTFQEYERARQEGKI